MEQERLESIKAQKDEERKEKMRIKKETLKLRVAVFYGYNGTKFQGSQFQKDTENTVEFLLEKALLESEVLPEESYHNHRKSQWNRGSRTDKGVHALCNTIGVKLEVNIKYVDDYDPSQNREENKQRVNYGRLVNSVNAHLDTSIIQVMDIKPVLSLFDVKKYASDRLYHYLCPLEMFTQQGQTLPIPREEAQHIVNKINTYLNKYQGTHRFHNYTVKVQATDDQAKRTIRQAHSTLHHVQELVNPLLNSPDHPPDHPLPTSQELVNPPLNSLLNSNPTDHSDTPLKKVKQEGSSENTWWVKVQIRGSSFMYHQIRKMMGLVMQTISEQKTEEYFMNSFLNNKMYLWLAPADGLFLDRIYFKGYNSRKDIPEQLEFSSEVQNKIENFRQQVIHKEIINRQISSTRFTQWKALIIHSDWDIEDF